MRTLIYKRTHIGDPGKEGWFGINGCMGQVRAYDFDAVIGVGGIGQEPIENGIAQKITWIGTGAKKEDNSSVDGHPMITFEHFILFDEKGEGFSEKAPVLAKRLFDSAARHFMMDSDNEEIERILAMAKDSLPSQKEPPVTKRREDETCDC